MADPNRTPTLPSTADSTPYVPLSWMAVSAFTASALFVFLLIVMLIFGKNSLFSMNKALGFLAIVGFLLSFAGRRMIRNSEGTRTGEKLASAAWWTCVVGGLGFAAYLFAIEFSINRDAKNEIEAWVGFITKEDPKDPKNTENLNRAFIRTLEPQRRPQLHADDTATLETQFRDQYISFMNSDLVRTVRRNRGKCRFEVDGVKDREDRPYGVECSIMGTLKCPEGTFPCEIPMRGVDSFAGSQTSGRQWMMAVPQGNVFLPDKIARTDYGWQIALIEKSASEYGRDFFKIMEQGTVAHPWLYHSMIGPESEVPFWMSIGKSTPTRLAVGGGPSSFTPFYTAEQARFYRDQFCKLPGGADPDQEQKNRFKAAWDTLGLVLPGVRLKSSQDKASAVVLGDRAIEVHLPCELPFPGTEATAARCRLVIANTDRAKLDELNRLRDEANADQGSTTPPDRIKTESYMWRVSRVETDLYPIETARQQMPRPGAPGTPGGPGGGP